MSEYLLFHLDKKKRPFRSAGYLLAVRHRSHVVVSPCKKLTAVFEHGLPTCTTTTFFNLTLAALTRTADSVYLSFNVCPASRGRATLGFLSVLTELTLTRVYGCTSCATRTTYGRARRIAFAVLTSNT